MEPAASRVYRELGLEVDQDGKVTRPDGHVYPWRLNKSGYLRISVYDARDKSTYTYLIHRLIAQRFIPNPYNYPVVNHKDANKLNNSLENLEWCTQTDNVKHAYEHGLIKFEPRKGGKRDWKGRFVG